MNIFWELLKALPEIVRLLEALQKQQQEVAVNRKVSEDIKTIHEAFNEKDPAKLNALFNSK